MNIEYAIHDPEINETEIKNTLTTIVKYENISLISVLPAYLKICKSLIDPKTKKISTPIDYPFGMNNTDIRSNMVLQAAKNGASIVDVMIPFYPVCNRKYDKFRVDVQTLLELCNNLGIELRYTLEYRTFTYDTLYKISQILINHNLNDVILSSGYKIDNIYDNIIAGIMLKKKNPKLNIIYNGNIWNKVHLDQIITIKPKNIRLYSLNSLKLFTM